MKNGNLGEAATILELMKQSYEIYTPAFDNGSYDLIAHKDGKLLKVEVKSTARKEGNKWVVQIKKVRSNKTKNVVHKFDKNFVDILAVYIAPLERVILIDSSTITTKNEIRITGELAESGLLRLS